MGGLVSRKKCLSGLNGLRVHRFTSKFSDFCEDPEPFHKLAWLQFFTDHIKQLEFHCSKIHLVTLQLAVRRAVFVQAGRLCCVWACYRSKLGMT